MKTQHIYLVDAKGVAYDEKVLAKAVKAVVAVRKQLANETESKIHDLLSYDFPRFMGREHRYDYEDPEDLTLRTCGPREVEAFARGVITEYCVLDVKAQLQTTYGVLRDKLQHMLFLFSAPLCEGSPYLRQLFPHSGIPSIYKAVSAAMTGLEGAVGVYRYDHFEYCFPLSFENNLPLSYQPTFRFDMSRGDNDSAVVTIRQMFSDYLKSFAVANSVYCANKNNMPECFVQHVKFYMSEARSKITDYLNGEVNIRSILPRLTKKIYNMQGWRNEKAVNQSEPHALVVNTIHSGLLALEELQVAVTISDLPANEQLELLDYMESLHSFLCIAYCSEVLENLTKSRAHAYYSKHGMMKQHHEDCEPCSLAVNDDEEEGD